VQKAVYYRVAHLILSTFYEKIAAYNINTWLKKKGVITKDMFVNLSRK